MIGQFFRSPLEKYQRIIANTHGGDTVINGLLLTPEQMAVILQIYDYGVDGINEEEKNLLWSVVGQLKSLIHP